LEALSLLVALGHKLRFALDTQLRINFSFGLHAFEQFVKRL
jgi:hypothetical protein